MKDENTPEFENRDHAIIQELLQRNTAEIVRLKVDIDWIKRLLIFVIIPLIIAIFCAVIGLGTAIIT